MCFSFEIENGWLQKPGFSIEIGNEFSEGRNMFEQKG